MQRELSARTAVKKQDLRNRLSDGVFPVGILFLTWWLVTLTIRPVSRSLGTPGLLAYGIGLLAVSMFALQQSLDVRHPDTARAWYGIAGGVLAWYVVEISANLGTGIDPSGGVVQLIMAALIVALLWRSGLPLGARFFSLAFLISWAEMILMIGLEWLAGISPVFTLVYRAAGFLAAAGALLILGWILFHSRRRIERVHGALVLWFLITLALYVFKGSLF